MIRPHFRIGITVLRDNSGLLGPERLEHRRFARTGPRGQRGLLQSGIGNRSGPEHGSEGNEDQSPQSTGLLVKHISHQTLPGRKEKMAHR
jgi:hypothetical protein